MSTEMRQYSDCYIAFLDLMGFKGIIGKKECEEIASFFDKIQERYIVEVQSTGKVLMDYRRLKMKIMSDSICFYVEASVRNALAGLVAICTHFQFRMLRFHEPILTRGAIVNGKIYAQKDMTFGPGLVQAYLMEEKTAKYPRVIFTKSLIKESKSLDNDGIDYIDKFTFSDEDAFISLDYLYWFYGTRHENQDWKDFAAYVQKQLETETDATIREKYLYVNKNIDRVRRKLLDDLNKRVSA